MGAALFLDERGIARAAILTAAAFQVACVLSFGFTGTLAAMSNRFVHPMHSGAFDPAPLYFPACAFGDLLPSHKDLPHLMGTGSASGHFCTLSIL
jgi:hypothetical protein